MKIKFSKKYLLLWISQFISQLGSAMTSFSMIIWVFNTTHNTMSVSALSFFSYMPYILTGFLAGSIVDRFKKKNIVVTCDLIAALCSLCIFILFSANSLHLWHLYFFNSIISFMNAFQNPASLILIKNITAKEDYSRVSGMNTLLTSLISIASPVFSTSILGFFGINAILIIDIISFIIGEFIIVFLIKVDEKVEKQKSFDFHSIIENNKEAKNFLYKNKLILYIIISFTVMNLLSNLTYENILSPMILARSNNNMKILGSVNCILGLCGVLGGIYVSSFKLPKDKIKIIFFCSRFSFLFGDILMGLGQNVLMWCMAGICASFPIAFIMSAQMDIIYRKIPEEMLSRILSLRNTIQYCTIPVGLLSGGFLAQYIFEPFMKSNTQLSFMLQTFVGTGNGSGMAVMFLCTGCLGFLSCMILYSLIKNIHDTH